jgi:hypothetical protein
LNKYIYEIDLSVVGTKTEEEEEATWWHYEGDFTDDEADGEVGGSLGKEEGSEAAYWSVDGSDCGEREADGIR